VASATVITKHEEEQDMHSLETIIESYTKLIDHLRERGQPVAHLEQERAAYQAQLARSRGSREDIGATFLEQANERRARKTNPLVEKRTYRGH
jgi:hypothetical protein